MSTFDVAKVLAALPDPLEADKMYCVRVGTGFDFYVTDSTGSLAYKINAAQPGAINDQTGAAYTLALGDLVNGTRHTNAAAIEVTIPLNAAVAFPRYIRIPIRQGGAGAVTIAGGDGVTVHAPNGAATAALGDARVIEQTDIDVWTVW